MDGNDGQFYPSERYDMKQIQAVTLSRFDLIRSTDSVEPERVYKITNSHGDFRYGWSPDGIGVYWYRSLAELVDEHGEV